MKLKKFNTILAAGLLGGGLLVWTAWGLIAPSVEYTANSGNTMPTITSMFGGDSTKAIDGYSEVNKQVVNVAWSHYQGQIPGKTSLKKWTVDDRTYYQVSGPINPAYRDKQVGDWRGQWREYTALEVFFTRGGQAYDQWLIAPSGSVILHFDHGERKTQSESPLPDSRFKTVIEDDQMTVTFWCSKDDTPANIVFNYNQGNGKTRQPLSWVSTDQQCEENTWVHHVPKWWTHP